MMKVSVDKHSVIITTENIEIFLSLEVAKKIHKALLLNENLSVRTMTNEAAIILTNGEFTLFINDVQVKMGKELANLAIYETIENIGVVDHEVTQTVL